MTPECCNWVAAGGGDFSCTDGRAKPRAQLVQQGIAHNACVV